MSFTDGLPRVATERDVRAPWCGYRDGSAFRCRLCGHRFQVGDVWRFVFLNFATSECHHGNCLVCERCDGPDVVQRLAAQEVEAKQRFWWLRREP